jgi:hypothetical protein
VAKIRLDRRKSTRLFKGIICDDISEFESHMPSHAVWSLWDMSRLQNYRRVCNYFPNPAANQATIMKNIEATSDIASGPIIDICATQSP